MRVTNSMQYRDMYGENNKIGKALFDVNKQIASGQKIQYAHEDSATFIDTMRLDNEVTALTQTKKSSESAYKFSTQTDTVLGDFSKTLDSIKVKLVSAANGSHSNASLDAIAQELRGLEKHMLVLADTSINGQYLFSGTQTATKPLDGDKNYVANDGQLNAFLGNDIKQKYNISGTELFLGEESNTQRKITTNVKQLSLNDLYPDIMRNDEKFSQEKYITNENTIRDLMGDNDDDITNDYNSYFYIRGSKSDGTAFKQKITMTSNQKIDDLLKNIETQFGTGSVNVTLNKHGQIEIEDKLHGSSKLDFHITGAIDFSGGTGANVTDINNLNVGTTDFVDAVDNNKVYIKEFVKSGLDSSVATAIDGLMYDRVNFSQNGMELEGNISQIVKNDNSFAVDSTKLGDVFSDFSSSLHVKGNHRDDGSVFDIDIDLSAATVSVSGDYTYTVGDGDGNDIAPADMTYRQLMDVVNMAINRQTPADNDAGYRAAIEASNTNSMLELSFDGKINFKDLTSNTTSTQAGIAIYDINSNDFTQNASMATFSANNTLSIRDPKTDFFKQLNEAITAVEEGRYRADGDTVDPRNGGIQNGIQIIDDLNEHVNRMQAQAGSQSQSLRAATDRTEMLLVNTKILRSEVLDVDIAEATLHLQQLSLNYEAMFSSVSRISQLSLVNYL